MGFFSGFIKTSEYFRVGKTEDNESLSSFSHQVKWTKGARGAMQVFPAHGHERSKEEALKYAVKLGWLDGNSEAKKETNSRGNPNTEDEGASEDAKHEEALKDDVKLEWLDGNSVRQRKNQATEKTPIHRMKELLKMPSTFPQNHSRNIQEEASKRR
ncbi:J domain-containing protein [Forsythia ovata]|uniref:J domain-containing protein n=1 Tax=Forsythia ovata TaxID=205694 RepID=A0ABD1P262_9LAMI